MKNRYVVAGVSVALLTILASVGLWTTSDSPLPLHSFVRNIAASLKHATTAALQQSTMPAMPRARITTPQLSNLRAEDLSAAMNARPGSVTDKLRDVLQLNAQHKLSTKKTIVDKKGNTHTRIQQHYRGLPVWGQQIIVHQSPQQDVFSVNGYAFEGTLDQDTERFIDQMDNSRPALQKIVRTVQQQLHLNRSRWKVSEEKIKPVLYVDKKSQQLAIAYELSWSADQRKSADVDQQAVSSQHATRPQLIVNAQTLTVIAQWESLESVAGYGPGGNGRTGDVYYDANKPLDVEQSGNTCRLRTADYTVVDSHHRIEIDNTPIEFNCPENTYKFFNGANSPANDAHYFTGVTFKAFNDWYGGNPLDDAIYVRVHWGEEVDNAYGGGSGRSLKFGDGSNGSRYPFTVLDIVGHEFGHQITRDNSGLVYSNESGGMNEAFSDASGAMVEYFHKGTFSYQFGANVYTDLNGKIRDTANPGIQHVDQYADGMDPHSASGIFNRAFYLLSLRKGWDIRKAYEMFLFANINFWIPAEEFNEGLCGLLASASILGMPTNDVVEVFALGGVVCAGNTFNDFDNDGMEDGYELHYGLRGDFNDSALDPDGDGLTNIQEYNLRSSPTLIDSDNDSFTDLSERDAGTNPNMADSDMDGLDDMAEVWWISTDPLKADTDGDNQPDGWEVNHQLDPFVVDSSGDFDGDGLSNGDEFVWRTNPEKADTDNDGFTDGDEVVNTLTRPGQADTDGDGIIDGSERDYGTNPLLPDSDYDELLDGDELEWNTDPLDADSDDDGLKDGIEVGYGSDPLRVDTDSDGMPDNWEARYIDDGMLIASNDANGDIDGDGLSNINEFTATTLPNNADTDNDYARDGGEVQFGFNPKFRGDVFKDTDNDGWTSEQEIRYGSHPLSATETRDGLPPTPSVPSSESIRAYVTTRCVEQAVGDDPPVYVCKRSSTISYGWFGDNLDSNENRLYFRFPPSLWAISAAELRYTLSEFSGNPSGEFYSLTDMIPALASNLTSTQLWNAIATGTTVFSGSHINSHVGQARAMGFPSSYLTTLNQNNNEIAVGLMLTDLQRGTDAEKAAINEPNLRLQLTYAADTDRDGLSDSWERANNLGDPLGDPDNDGAVNLQEQFNKTNPNNKDSDSDGIWDGPEIFAGLDPTLVDAKLDSDGDGLNNETEVYYGLSPLNTDSDLDGKSDNLAIDVDNDKDGLADVWELRFALNPSNPEDAFIDSDGDGWTNIQEFYGRTHPKKSSTSGDGLEAKPVRSPGVATRDFNRGWSCNVNGSTTTCGTGSVGYQTIGQAGRGGEYNYRALLGFHRMSRFWHAQTIAFEGKFESMNNTAETVTLSDVETLFEGEIADPVAAYGDLGSGGEYGQLNVTRGANYSTNLNTALKEKYNWQPDHVDIGLAIDLPNDLASGSVTMSARDSMPRLIFVYQPDSDGDNLTDDWEMQYGSRAEFGDEDNDGASNLQEYLQRTNPSDSDTDDDGMPDGWEMRYGLNPNSNDASADPDADTLTNGQEYTGNTSPLDADTDDDGIPDNQDTSNNELPSTVSVFNDWGTGYCANIIVTNNTNRSVDWISNFTVNGTINQVWEMIYRQNGSTVTAEGVSWNNILQPGERTRDMGFCATRNNGSYSITVRALGSSGQESINLTVGGQTVKTWTLSKDMKDYTATTSLAGGINVAFTNDATGRDVRIDRVVINGTTYEAEAQTTNTGVYGNGRCGGGSQSEWLHCNGYIGFSAYR